MKTIKKAINVMYRKVFISEVAGKTTVPKEYEHFDYLSLPT